MALICATCNQPNPEGATSCRHCSSIFPAANGLVHALAAQNDPLSSAAAGRGATAIAPAARTLRAESVAFAFGTLAEGTLLGPRYEIVELLGKGGMGAVYLARDLELGREVALKLIAPYLAADPAVLERFKREIQLSSIVTHANVLRVYDLGDADGIKFLTMQYIAGESLAGLLQRERPLPVDQALALFRQICAGLAAAHDKAVLHRDLKPQNVMVDAAGQVYLTDFGLATSRTLSAVTQTGALMGTPQYMSPEQVTGGATDARSDIFSLGIILYEMLTGVLPYSGDNLFQLMMARVQAPPRPAGEVNPAIPVYLRKMLDRCLAVDPALRYASVAEILGDLDAGTVRAPLPRPRRRVPWRALAAGLALLVAVVLGVVGTTVGRRLLGEHEAPPKQVTLLVADLDNRTGEEVFEGTLESALAVALEGASFVSVYGRSGAVRVAEQLHLEGAGLPEKRARLVAQREGIAIVTSGYVEREGSGYRIAVRAVDAFTGQRIDEKTMEVSRRDGVLGGVNQIAARLRKSLGDATPESVQLKEGETFGAGSLEAAHEYSMGMELQASGKSTEAASHYIEALKLDPDLGRAYAGLAAMEDNRGNRSAAEKYYKEAMARLHRMSEREKFRTLGVYYLFIRDTDKAVEAYSALVKQFPADTVGLANLSMAYALRGDFARSLEEGRRALALYPKNVLTRNNVGFIAMFAGDLDGALAEQRKVLELNPTFVNGHAGLALAQLVAGQPAAALATWTKLQRLGGDGASAAADGLADLAMYEGRLTDARVLLEEAVALELAQEDHRYAAGRKLVTLAEAYLATRRAAKAVAAAGRALQENQDGYVAFAAANVLALAGFDERATAVADDLDRQLGAEPRMYAELVRGSVELRRRNYPEATSRFRNAVRHLDSWLARFALGRAYLEAGAYPAALDELERCEKRRGEASDAYQDTFPTYHLYPPVRYYLARAHEGLRSPAAADGYRAFLALKKGDEDPLVPDARRRLAALGGAR